MAYGMRVVSVHIEYVDHEIGHWCRTCLLSTGIRIWVAVIATTAGLHLQQRLHCYECGGHDITLDT